MKREHAAWVEVGFGVASVAVGLLLIAGPRTALFEAYNASVEAAFWAPEPMPEAAQAMSHWLLATCGAGVVGWGIAWAQVSHIPFRRGEPWAHRCLAWSLVIWGALDVAIAASFGVHGELIFVFAALLGAGLPLALSRSSVTPGADEIVRER